MASQMDVPLSPLSGPGASTDVAGSYHTLWCKQSFQQCFSDKECVLFALQQQLFQFLDAKGSSGGEEWLPFSIEFPSEMEVAERLSVHTRPGRRAAPLFSSAAPTSGESNGVASRKRPRRESFSLLYGNASLSTQTRMFLATTFTGLQRITSRIEPLQRHLYEIIREHSPCHLYFDVERETDCVGTCDEITVSDSDASDNDDDREVRCEPSRVVCADLERGDSRRGRHSFRMPQSQYDKLVGAAVGVPAHHCRLDCPHRPDNASVESTLLRELRQFLCVTYPDVFAPRPVCSDIVGENDAVFEEIIVMRSAPVQGSASGFAAVGTSLDPVPQLARPPPSKFSQHYLIKLRGYCFENAAAAGAFVLAFVDYLQERATDCAEVHRRLFFHGAPVPLSVLPLLDEAYGSSALPFLPRKCVIDTAVYSRNRMMRCLGCCKLHKSAVLGLERHWVDGVAKPIESGDDARSSFPLLVRSLISLPSASFESRRRVPVVVSEKRTKVPLPLTASTAPLASVELQPSTQQALFAELSDLYSGISGRPCSVVSAKQRSEQYLVVPILGTRFCQNVHREHRSNNVYFVVDMCAKTAVQKCFDPDCAHFRSTPTLLSSLTLPPP